MLKNLIIVVALMLTIFAGNAQAQVFSTPCSEGSTEVFATIPIECDVNGVSYSCGTVKVKYCYKCPNLSQIPTKLEIYVLEIDRTNLSSQCPCNIQSEINNFLMDYNRLLDSCPVLQTLPPCGTNDYVELAISWPLCWNFSSQDIIEPCLPIDCYCVGTWRYCYLNGQVQNTYVNTGIVNAPGYSGPCPVPSSACDIYDYFSVPKTTFPSPCFMFCE